MHKPTRIRATQPCYTWKACCDQYSAPDIVIRKRALDFLPIRFSPHVHIINQDEVSGEEYIVVKIKLTHGDIESDQIGISPI